MSNHRPTRILFLARRYPPSIGGIETHGHELYTRLVKQADVRLVALGHRSLLHLAWFLPYCLWTTFWAVLLRRRDVLEAMLEAARAGLPAPINASTCSTEPHCLAGTSSEL